MGKLLFIWQIIGITLAFIRYDKGNFYDTNIAGYNCQNGYSTTLIQYFSEAFEIIPQVIFTHETFDLDKAVLEYKMSITTITKTYFILALSCSNKKVNSLRAKWLAFDDQRIQVINNFNMANPDDKTFQINNPNAQYGFVLLTSMHYINEIDFLIYISEIKKYSVTVSITKVSTKFSNLLQIGYQVVVGVEEAIVNLGLKTVTGGFTSAVIPLQTNKWFLIATQGFNYANTDNLRVKAVWTGTSSTTSYTWGTWTGSQTPNSHSQIMLAYAFTKSFKAFECFTIRTSRKLVLDYDSLPTIYLEMPQINQIHTTIGNYNYDIDKSIQPLNMIIQVKCKNNQKVQAVFNKCNSCSSKKVYSFSYNCFNQMNYVGFFPIFKQAFQQYNIFKVNIQATTLEIKQVLYDYKVTEETIVQVQILNQ